MNFLQSEPVWSLVAGLGTVVQASIVLVSAFGVTLTPVQNLAVNSFVAVAIAWVLRARVSPTSGTQDGSTIGPAGSPAQDARNLATKDKYKQVV